MNGENTAGALESCGHVASFGSRINNHSPKSLHGDTFLQLQVTRPSLDSPL